MHMLMASLFVCGLAAVPFHAQQKSKTGSGYKPAPNFSRLNLAGQKTSLSDYRGRVVLLNFWATWCGPCITEMPVLAQWQKELGPSGLQVVGVSMDDEPKGVRAMTKKLRINYPVVMGDETIGTAYGGVLGLPVTFVIDRKGKIRSRHQGAIDIASLRREVQTLLKEHP